MSHSAHLPQGAKHLLEDGTRSDRPTKQRRIETGQAQMPVTGRLLSEPADPAGQPAHDDLAQRPEAVPDVWPAAAGDLATGTVRERLAAYDWRARTGLGAGQSPADPSNVSLRPQRSYIGARLQQLLIQLSVTLFTQLKASVSDAVEVQSMYANGRLFVSENSEGGRTGLAAMLQRQSIAKIAEAATKELRSAVLKRRAVQKRKTPLTPEQVTAAIAPTKQSLHGRMRKLMRAADQSRHWQLLPDADEEQSSAEGVELEEGGSDQAVLALSEGGADTLLANELARLLSQDPSLAPVVRVDADKAPDVLSDRAYAGKIIVVDGPSGFHAEQNLMWLLLKAGWTEGASISGKKRPCLGCYLTFKYMTELVGANIDFNPRPGYAWVDSIDNLGAFIKHKGDAASLANKLRGYHDLDEGVVIDAAQLLLDYLRKEVPKTANVTGRSAKTSTRKTPTRKRKASSEGKGSEKKKPRQTREPGVPPVPGSAPGEISESDSDDED